MTMNRAVTHNQAVGAYGERVAASHLVEAGMVVLDRNWRCADGEIDLVLRDGATLVVCEVKTRRTAVGGSPHEAVDATRVERLSRLGHRWAAERGIRPDGVRIDVVAVLRPERGPAIVDHVRGVC